MKGIFLFLGTGSSTGTPVIGCHCKVCLSTDEHNKRLRPSALLQVEGKNILIDPSPDFRFQALKEHIDKLDGVIITHAHYDHMGGLDDLRIYNLMDNKPLPCLVNKQTYSSLKTRMVHFFEDNHGNGSLGAKFSFEVIDKEGPYTFLGIPFTFFSFMQKVTQVLGLRIGDLAYLTDLHVYDENIFSYLHDLSTLIVSAPRKEPSPVHITIGEAVAFAKKVQAKKTYFTHIAHEVDHKAISLELPPSVHLAYDGLKVDFTLGS